MAIQVKQNTHIGQVIDPGHMDRVIELFAFATTIRDSGFHHQAFTSIGSVRAMVHREGGKEDEVALRVSEMKDKIFIIRYRAGMDARYRVQYEGQMYDVINIAELGRRKYLALKATAIVEI